MLLLIGLVSGLNLIFLPELDRASLSAIRVQDNATSGKNSLFLVPITVRLKPPCQQGDQVGMAPALAQDQRRQRSEIIARTRHILRMRPLLMSFVSISIQLATSVSRVSEQI